jgi:hypothetical protein
MGGEFASFPQHILGGPAAFTPAREGNQAKAAHEIAAVLNLQQGAG